MFSEVAIVSCNILGHLEDDMASEATKMAHSSNMHMYVTSKVI